MGIYYNKQKEKEKKFRNFIRKKLDLLKKIKIMSKGNRHEKIYIRKDSKVLFIQKNYGWLMNDYKEKNSTSGRYYK